MSLKELKMFYSSYRAKHCSRIRFLGISRIPKKSRIYELRIKFELIKFEFEFELMTERILLGVLFYF